MTLLLVADVQQGPVDPVFAREVGRKGSVVVLIAPVQCIAIIAVAQLRIVSAARRDQQIQVRKVVL